MPNHPTVTTLVDLARTDLSIVHAKKKIRTLNDKAKHLAETVVNAQVHLRDSQTALSQLRQTEADTQQKLESYRRRKKTAIGALEKGLGNPESAQRQIEQCGKIIDDLEFALLECLENQESAATKIKAAEASVKESVEIAERFETERSEETNQLTVLVNSKTATRTEIINGLDVVIKNRYEQLRRSKGTAVARVVDDCCRSCQMALPMQDSSDLRRGRIIHCRKCGRWLFMPDDE